MEDKQSRLLMAMALVLAVLIGLLLFLEPPPADREPGEASFTPLWPGLEASAVTALSLETVSGSVDAVRTQEGWALRSPAEGPADTARLEGLVRSMVTIEATEGLELGEAPAAVGLDAFQSVRVTLEDEAGQRHALSVGMDAPVRGGTYITDAAGAVRLTRLPISSAVRPDPDSLRSRSIVRFATSAVTRLRVSGPARALVLERLDRDWWVREEGHELDGKQAEVPSGRHRADADRVSEALQALHELQALAFPDGPQELSNEALRITLTTPEGEQVVVIGSGADGAPLVKGSGTPAPVPADLSSLDPVLAAPGTAWRSAVLLPIRPVTIDRIGVRIGDVALDTDREGLTWQDPRADGVLNALADIRVDRRAPAPPPSGDAWGEIALGEGDAPPARVQLYQAVVGGRVAQDVAGGDPFVVGDGALSSLEAALAGEPGSEQAAAP